MNGFGALLLLPGVFSKVASLHSYLSDTLGLHFLMPAQDSVSVVILNDCESNPLSSLLEGSGSAG